MKHTIIVMGVSGCGKSTIGLELADQLGAAFYDGDDFHPQVNIDKMSAGIPLDDDDRLPWLEAVLGKLRNQQSSSVTACSALKKKYRAILRKAGSLTFVYLKGDKPTLLERLKFRSEGAEHFMPAHLLDSQLHTLESPEDETDVLTVEIDQPTSAIVQDVLSQLK